MGAVRVDASDNNGDGDGGHMPEKWGMPGVLQRDGEQDWYMLWEQIEALDPVTKIRLRLLLRGIESYEGRQS